MSICSLASQAVGGLTQGTGGSILGNVANVLGVLGAADIGVQLGTGGEAGLFDLPNLLNTAGIECVDSEGNVTLVTPIQWYANGMKCDGLRNPDQERIRREIEDFENRRRLREEIRNNQNIETGPGTGAASLQHIKEQGLGDGFGQSNSNISFDFDGILFFKGVTTSSTFFSTWMAFQGLLAGGQSSKSPVPQDELRAIIPSGKMTQTGVSRFSTASSYADATLYNSSVEKWRYFSNILVIDKFGNPTMGSNPTIQSFRVNNFTRSGELNNSMTNLTVESTGTTGYVAQLRFVADVPPPGIFIDVTPGDSRPRDPVSPCNDGRRRRQPMPCQQCKLTPDLINKINQLHKACAADRLANGMPYFPEKDIRSYGRQLYQTNPNNVNGQVKPGNLIDVIAATIAAEYHRLGLQRLPAELPESLIPKTNALAEAVDRDTVKVDNCLSFHEQIFKLHDEVLGQWPIHLKVTDDGKTNDVKLWNLSEAVAELYGMQTKVVEDADLAVHWGIRSATEASKAGNAALKALHLLQELVKFTGVITTPGTITVTSTFTPDPVGKQTTEQMLQPSVQTLMVTNIVDGSSLLELLKTISYAAQISAKAVLQPLKPNPATGQPAMPGDFIKTERKKRRVDDKAFEKWKKEKEQPLANIPEQQRPPGYKVPDIKVMPQPDDKK